IFNIEPVAWDTPEPAPFDAVLLTSANAAIEGLQLFTHLPCYAVGERSAEAARSAGFSEVRTGPADGAAILEMMAQAGVRRAFHPCGRDHMQLDHPRIELERRIVYAAEAADALPADAVEALDAGALVLLHSPRAARHFATLVDAAGLDRSRIALAAISKAAASAAGPGWGKVAAADAPREAALLELAVRLCKSGDERYGRNR
ncbi:MAG TPA: uroporphyrinogen-III synthase, partial [Allosphingosinicella sp.]|nr:uroporphyrinogen-III synthase [Allosphingosinicella sp.]